jgi:uncharacterized membrane protein
MTTCVTPRSNFSARARILALVALSATALGLTSNVGCGDSDGSGGGADCTTVKGYSELGVAFSKCTNCHSSELTTPTERQSATVGFDYDTYALAAADPAAIIEQVEDDEMPPSGSPTLTETEKTDLLTWAECGTPE